MFFNLIFSIISIILNPIVFKHDSGKEKVIFNTNYGMIMSKEDLARVKNEDVKSIYIDSDSIKITLKGIRMIIPDPSDFKRSYKADLKINNDRCLYYKEDVPSHSPKTSQYNLSDSCFYLTFELSPKFQTKGIKAGLSVFLISDSIPRIGDKFPITPIAFEEDIPIIEWSKPMGNMAAVQLTYFPLVQDVIAKEFINISNYGKRIILSSSELHGEIEIVSYGKNGRNKNLVEMELNINLDGTLDSGHGLVPIRIEKGNIHLYQVEKCNLRPCIFEVCYIWPDVFIPKNSFD